MSYIQLKNLFEEHSLISDINSILNWDMATYMPNKSRKERVKQIKKLFDYKKRIFDEIKKKELFKKIEQTNLDDHDRLNLSLMQERFENFDTIPYEIVKKKTVLSIECEALWREAKSKSNFNIVKKHFSKLIDEIKVEADLLSQKKNKTKYDCLLNKYDRSLDTNFIRENFKKVEIFIKSKLPKIQKQQSGFKKLNFEDYLSENEQFMLSKIFMKKLNFDFQKGRIDKSLHPFCGGSTEDIRITTRFDKNDSFSCFDALMHETGHGLYEQGLPKKWFHQPLGNSGGMSLHESQSLFIEMQMIKSLFTSKYIENILIKKLKKPAKKWNYESIYQSRNKVEKNFIRVDSDEVHYPLHIIHRFNIEYQIIEEDYDVNYLPDIWNKEFLKIMDMKVINDSQGCLQDIHWFGGDFGYFPTYSIGAFIAAQLMNQIKKEIPNINLLLENGKFKPIITWLKNNIHCRGNIYKINDLLKLITGEELNVKHFKNHIQQRYIKESF